jgi:hypothetical protein
MTNKTNTYPLIIDDNARKIFPGSTEPQEFLKPEVTKIIELAIEKYDGQIVLTADKTAINFDKNSNDQKSGFLLKVEIMKK